MQLPKQDFSWQAVLAVFGFIALGVGIVLVWDALNYNQGGSRKMELEIAELLLGSSAPLTGLALASRLRYCEHRRDVATVFGRLGVAAALLSVAIGTTYLSYTYMPISLGHEVQFILPGGLYLASLVFVARSMNPPTVDPPPP